MPAPATPTISVAELTSTSVRITIGGEEGMEHYVLYATGLGGSWTAGGNRIGEGIVDITGLTAGANYYFYAYTTDVGYHSFSSDIDGLTLSGGDVLTTAAGLLEESLAASATFRTWTGAADAAAAKDFIHLWAIDEDDITRPIGLITPGENFRAERIAHGPGDWFDSEGQLNLTLEATYDTAETVASNINTFSLAVGKIMAEVLAVSGRGGYLAIKTLERSDGPGLANEDETERIIAATYAVIWD